MNIKRKVRGLLVLCILSIGSSAWAGGVVVPQRHDTGFIEDATISLQTAKEVYLNYVVYGLDELLSPIMDLQNTVGEMTQIVANEKSAFTNMFTNLKSSFNFDNIISGYKQEVEGAITSVANFEAIETGKGADFSFSGSGKDLSKVLQSNGFQGVAEVVTDRTQQCLTNAEEKYKDCSNTNNTYKYALARMYSFAPMLNPSIQENTFNLGYCGIYEKDDAQVYFLYEADNAMSIPAGRIAEIIGKYKSKNSPYSQDKYTEKVCEGMKQTLDTTKKIIEDKESAEYTSSGLNAVITKQNRDMMLQMNDLIAVQADINRLNAATGVLKAQHNTASLTETVNGAALAREQIGTKK